MTAPTLENLRESLTERSYEISIIFGHLCKMDLSEIPLEDVNAIHKACNRLNLYSRAIYLKVRENIDLMEGY